MANIMTRNMNGISPLAAFANFDRIVDNMLGGFHIALKPNTTDDFTPAFAPRVDVTETENAIEVTADLPGLERNDLQLDITHGVLTLQGERKTEVEQKDRTVYRMERTTGSFVRRIGLPVEVDSDKAEATFENGVLKVILPKSASSKPKQITIKS